MSYSFDCRNLYLNEEVSATIASKPTGGFSVNYIAPVLVEDLKCAILLEKGVEKNAMESNTRL